MAERSRLREELQTNLATCSRSFNEAIGSALRALYPAEQQISEMGRNAAWQAQYLRWRKLHGPLFTAAGIEIRTGAGFQFFRFDLSTGQLYAAERPDDCGPAFVEIPGPPGVPDHLLAGLNLDYIRQTMAPEIIASHLRDYDVEIVTATRPATLIYSSLPGAPPLWDSADAFAPLLDLRFGTSLSPRWPRHAAFSHRTRSGIRARTRSLAVAIDGAS